MTSLGHSNFVTVPETVLDGVHRLPPTGISILIVGGGIGGLTLANEAWRQGHDVRVLERSARLDVVGKSIPMVEEASNS